MRLETLIIISYDSKLISSSHEEYSHEYSSRIIIHRVTIDAKILQIPEMLKYVLRVR